MPSQDLYIHSAVIDPPQEMTSPITKKKKKALALAEYWCHKLYENLLKWFVSGSCIIPGR